MRNTYFITSTVNGWIPLFHRPEYAQVVLDSLAFVIAEERIMLHGYVIMPNHLHVILSIAEKYDLSSFLRDFHKFTSQQIIKIMRNEASGLLDRLAVKKK
ncbi:MAG: transposase [Nitrospinota bacterium]|nr:transposase [Nitrospinota bacterium]